MAKMITLTKSSEVTLNQLIEAGAQKDFVRPTKEMTWDGLHRLVDLGLAEKKKPDGTLFKYKLVEEIPEYTISPYGAKTSRRKAKETPASPRGISFDTLLNFVTMIRMAIKDAEKEKGPIFEQQLQSLKSMIADADDKTLETLLKGIGHTLDGRKNLTHMVVKEFLSKPYDPSLSPIVRELEAGVYTALQNREEEEAIF